ncbi:hypothetical protein ACFYVL_20545 [Streptomyces sp. NPDC004111]|uniref:hypothetical protein n=1 Tax=Streptomyces sp. NPDC004111 TaxID=3364690 RepID=UPI00369E5CE3
MVLVLAHLAGTVHATAPGGSHLELAAAVCARSADADPAPFRPPGPNQQAAQADTEPARANAAPAPAPGYAPRPAPGPFHPTGTAPPAHHHSTGEGHIEHPADRPRAAGPDVRDTPDPDAPPLAESALPAGESVTPGSYDPSPRHSAPVNPSGRSLLCVWRQ